MKILSAQFQRNGISGRPFFAAIVSDPFEANEVGPFLVISLNSGNNDTAEKPNPEETFVISMRDLNENQLRDKWRGDNVTPKCLAEIRKKVDEQRGW